MNTKQTQSEPLLSGGWFTTASTDDLRELLLNCDGRGVNAKRSALDELELRAFAKGQFSFQEPVNGRDQRRPAPDASST